MKTSLSFLLLWSYYYHDTSSQWGLNHNIRLMSLSLVVNSLPWQLTGDPHLPGHQVEVVWWTHMAWCQLSQCEQYMDWYCVYVFVWETFHPPPHNSWAEGKLATTGNRCKPVILEKCRCPARSILTFGTSIYLQINKGDFSCLRSVGGNSVRSYFWDFLSSKWSLLSVVWDRNTASPFISI